MTLEEAQKQVDQWVKTYGVRYFSELTNMAVLTEEVGELARVMARKYGDQSFKEGEKDNIDEEIADVLWVLLCIANQTGVDITDAFRKSMEKKKIETNNYGIRENLLKYDEVMNEQREVIYAERLQVLNGENMRDVIMKMLNDIVEGAVDMSIGDEQSADKWNFKELNELIP